MKSGFVAITLVLSAMRVELDWLPHIQNSKKSKQRKDDNLAYYFNKFPHSYLRKTPTH
jgi:hypothetical protein